MGSLVKSSGEWKNSLPYVKADGEWKVPKSAWTKTSNGWKSWFLQGGLNDSGFNNTDTNSGLNGTVKTIAVQSDGKFYVGGNFSFFGETLANGIARFDSNGNFDTDFALNVGSGFTINEGESLSINDIIIQPDGKILIVGRFDFFNGLPISGIVRINSDGSPDNSFFSNIGSGATRLDPFTVINSEVYKVGLQSDRKIIISGRFNEFNGIETNNILRLNSDGTIDTNFKDNTGPALDNLEEEELNEEFLSGPPSEIKSFAIQSDGKIVIVGDFFYFNNLRVNNIARLNTNGTIDTAFAFATGSGASLFLDIVELQPDQKIIIAGIFFDFFNGVEVPKVIRLSTNGTIDPTINVSPEAIPFLAEARKIIRQPDGKFIIAGIAVSRIGLDGTFDSDFIENLPESVRSPANDGVRFLSVALQADNKLIIPQGPNSKIGRLNSDGSLDNTFLANFFTGFSERVRVAVAQADGKFVLGATEGIHLNKTAIKQAIFRLNADGSLDENFLQNINNSEFGFSSDVNSIIIQPDGKILIGGSFSIRMTSTTSLNDIARFNSDGTQDLAFNQNLGKGFTSGFVQNMDIQSDGKIVVGGEFSDFNELPAFGLIRLNPDGTRDTSFVQTWPEFESPEEGQQSRNSVRIVKIQQDNKIIISGGPTLKFNGASYSSLGVLRFNSDGTVDNDYYVTFQSEKIFSGTPVTSMIIQSDGKLICSWLTGTGSPKGIARFNIDGTLDTGFAANIGRGVAFRDTPINGDPQFSISSIAIQEDEKIIIAGNFPKFNETDSSCIARINLDGTLDTEFTFNIGSGFGDNSSIGSLNIQEDNKIIACGTFNMFDGTNRKNLVRIGGDAATD
jgi:uncharacterized delta-60 repeat protein